jgi:hypothetical protein
MGNNQTNLQGAIKDKTWTKERKHSLIAKLTSDVHCLRAFRFFTCQTHCKNPGIIVSMNSKVD